MFIRKHFFILLVTTLTMQLTLNQYDNKKLSNIMAITMAITMGAEKFVIKENFTIFLVDASNQRIYRAVTRFIRRLTSVHYK